MYGERMIQVEEHWTQGQCDSCGRNWEESGNEMWDIHIVGEKRYTEKHTRLCGECARMLKEMI